MIFNQLRLSILSEILSWNSRTSNHSSASPSKAIAPATHSRRHRCGVFANQTVPKEESLQRGDAQSRQSAQSKVVSLDFVCSTLFAVFCLLENLN